MKATRKEFYMEIHKSRGRFLSILFIVALGCAFFSGIRASEPDMRLSGDAYYDTSNLMDIKAVSTLGVTDTDVAAIEDMDSISRAEGGYSSDFLCQGEDRQIAVHVQSMSAHMNEVTVSEGRLPQKPGECLADDDLSYKVGDVITLEPGGDDPVMDTLTTDTLKVVGRGNTPCYISFGRGSTAIGTGSISGFITVTANTFDLDVYTEVYAQVKGAKALMSYTDAYEEAVEDALEEMKLVAKKQGKLRKQKLVNDANKEVEKARQKWEEGKAQSDKELSDAAALLSDGEQQIADAKVTLSDGRNQIANAKATLSSKQQELDQARAQYESGKQQYDEGIAAYEQQSASFEQKRAEAEGQKATLAGQQQQLEAAIDQMQQQYDAIPEEGRETEEAKALAGKIAASMEQLKQIKGGIAQIEQQLGAGQSALADAKSKLDASKSQLDSALSQIQSGQSQIDSGWSEIKSQERTISEGEAELSSKAEELASAKAEYEDGKKEAEQKLLDGQNKINDAEREIKKIENPKWYLYDRSTLPEYDGFGDNADRMRAIGRVFPALFFLVAALISLTGMTRMVEEQRTEIGTMKALGYSKGKIASKYLGYAFLATVGGSVSGVLIGEKVLPYIIIYAYEIMYRHLPEILIPYQLSYGAEAILLSVVCTMGATFLACYKELAAQPAVLMRPPAPKKGKRVILERIPILWRHLSFTWKSTIRNLMRYKKRFFMTVFGIGGCMALMLVGFGLRDSIFDIAGIQYDEIQTYDGTAYLQEDLTTEDYDHIRQFMKEDKEVSGFMEATMKNVTLTKGDKEREAYECVPQSVKEVPDFIKFRDRRSHEVYELSDDGIIISEKTAKMLDAEVGDTIYIKVDEDSKNPVKIAAICENYMGHYFYLTSGLYQEVYEKPPEYNCIFYKVKSQEKGKLEAAGQRILKEDEVLSIGYLHDIEKQLNDMLKSLNLVIVVLIVSAGMLAFVVLYNLNNINITERQRELATIKVLGFYDPEVAAYVYRENIILTFVGALAGMGIGRLLHLFIIQTVEVDSAMFGRNINFPSYLYSLFFTVAFSLFVNGVMYFKLKKIDMVESLKSIE